MLADENRIPQGVHMNTETGKDNFKNIFIYISEVNREKKKFNKKAIFLVAN